MAADVSVWLSLGLDAKSRDRLKKKNNDVNQMKFEVN